MSVLEVLLGPWGYKAFVWVVSRTIRWLNKDRKRDLLVLMGPKQNGKSEFLSALRLESFCRGRAGSGLMPSPKEWVWGEKRAVALDADGAESNIASYTENILDYVAKNKPEFVVLALVIDMSELVSVDETVCSIGQYLDYVVDAFEGERERHLIDIITRHDIDEYTQCVYNQGKWGYVLIGTHAAGQKNKRAIMKEVAKRMEKYRGKIRRLDNEVKSMFELSDEKERKSAVVWMRQMFENVHKM